jgi:hypothetical protein
MTRRGLRPMNILVRLLNFICPKKQILAKLACGPFFRGHPLPHTPSARSDL